MINHKKLQALEHMDKEKVDGFPSNHYYMEALKELEKEGIITKIKWYPELKDDVKEEYKDIVASEGHERGRYTYYTININEIIK